MCTAVSWLCTTDTTGDGCRIPHAQDAAAAPVSDENGQLGGHKFVGDAVIRRCGG